jgi:adenylosuccinate lyase
VDAHLIDSRIYGHGWSTPESHELFSESKRVARWVAVLRALAVAQADLGIIPASAAEAIAALDGDRLDLAAIGAETRRTGHSAAGLILELQAHLPESARDYVYYGATVQDVSDTSAALELADLGSMLWRDLRHVEAGLLDLARHHRATAMVGRTHGQPGAPISFGFKVASWADEVARHIERLRQARPRIIVGQLAGAVGVLGFYGADGPALRRRFCAELGLGDPGISWLSSRDRLAEFAGLSAMASSTLARMANEVYNLQRQEIGELSEGTPAANIGSITMPHKRNPEGSEQIVVLARMIRASAGLLTETMVGDHERDGRSWKTEWVALPELGHYLLATLHLSCRLVDELEVDVEAMASALGRSRSLSSQELLRRLSPRMGKHEAQAEIHRCFRQSRLTGVDVADLIAEIAEPAEMEGLDDPALGSAEAMVGEVVRRATERRSDEPAAWA